MKMRVAVALTSLVVSGALFLSGCRSNVKSDASIAIVKDKDAPEISLGSRKAALPKGDVGATLPPVVQDRSGKRLAYRTTGGMARIVYVIGEGLFLGPLVPLGAKDKVDFKAVPSTDYALASLFETATATSRADLVKEIRRERGEAGVVRLLIDGVSVHDESWEETRRTLSPEREKELRDGLVSGLDTGKPWIVMRRALGLVDLKAEWRKKMIPERAKELVASDGDMATRDRGVTAMMLRAAIYHDKKAAAAVACDALAIPLDEHDSAGQHKLQEAAAITLLVTGTTTCPNQQAMLNTVNAILANACLPYYRCNAEGPLNWYTTTRQDEPLCDRDQILKAAREELDRPAREVLLSSSRAELFAYGVALLADAVPASFTTAHERRRYAITMPSEPTCEPPLTPAGAPCHCEEAVVRDAACKGRGDRVEAFMCRFDVDDKAKRLTNVVGGTPGSHPVN